MVMIKTDRCAIHGYTHAYDGSPRSNFQYYL